MINLPLLRHFKCWCLAWILPSRQRTHIGIAHRTEMQLSVPNAEVPVSPQGRWGSGSQHCIAASSQATACPKTSSKMCVLQTREEGWRRGRACRKLIAEAHALFLSCICEISQPFQEHDSLWMNMLLVRAFTNSVGLHKPWLFRKAA